MYTKKNFSIEVEFFEAVVLESSSSEASNDDFIQKKSNNTKKSLLERFQSPLRVLTRFVK